MPPAASVRIAVSRRLETWPAHCCGALQSTGSHAAAGLAMHALRRGFTRGGASYNLLQKVVGRALPVLFGAALRHREHRRRMLHSAHASQLQICRAGGFQSILGFDETENESERINDVKHWSFLEIFW